MISSFVFYNPHLAIIIFSLILVFVINLFYKFLINQEEAKQLKQRQKELKEEMKTYRKEGNAEKTTELFSEMMQLNNKMMKLTLKPMLASLIIIAIFLPMVASFFDITATFEDNHATIDLGGNVYEITRSEDTFEVTGPAEFECNKTCRQYLQNTEWNIRLDGNKIVFVRILVLLPFSLPLIGDDLGWLGCYIIISFILVMPIRKLLKINI